MINSSGFYLPIYEMFSVIKYELTAKTMDTVIKYICKRLFLIHLCKNLL